MRHQAYITMNQRWCLSFTTRDFSRHFSLKLQQYKLASNIPSSNPWGSMYGISTYIWLIFMVEMYVNIPVPWILRECYVQTDITKLIFQPHLPSSVQVHHLGATKISVSPIWWLSCPIQFENLCQIVSSLPWLRGIFTYVSHWMLQFFT